MAKIMGGLTWGVIYMYVPTYMHTYMPIILITSARSKVILIYRDVETCRELCVITCVHISQARLSAPAATLANTRRLQVSKVCALCVFVSFQKKKSGIHTHSITHNSYIIHTNGVNTNLFPQTIDLFLTHTLSIYIDTYIHKYIHMNAKTSLA